MESRLASPKDNLFVVSENKRARNTRYLVPTPTPPGVLLAGYPPGPPQVLLEC